MLLVILFVSITGTCARQFNVTYLSIPETVVSSQTEAEFECRYEGNFTVLNWYKGPDEFFKYRPGDAPSTRSFPIRGVGRLEVLNCGPTVCRLRLGALTEEATGWYRCDIERDVVVPHKFASKSAYMRVYGHEHRKPIVEGLATHFGEGDEMQAYCRSDHFAEVLWYINGREIKEMDGSHALKYKSSRLIFSGVPPTVTVQCAQEVNGMLVGSKGVKAHWVEPITTYGGEIAQEQKNRANDVFSFNIIIVFVTFSFLL